MKKIGLLSLAVATAIVSLSGCKGHDNSELAHNHEAHDHAEHAHAGHDHAGHDHAGHAHAEHAHGDDVIELSPETAEQFGVHAVKAELRPFGGAIKASGSLSIADASSAVVAAPVSGVVTLGAGVGVGSEVHRGATVALVKSGVVSGSAGNDVARAELDAARAELDRLTPLYEQRLVTQARYNEARAAYERARAAYSEPAASGSAAAPVAGVITAIYATTGAYVEAGQPIAAVSASDMLTLRVDVPVRHRAVALAATDARIIVPGTDETYTLSALGGKRLNNTSAAASAGYVPVFFSVPASGELVAGQAVEVYLCGPTAGEALVVPKSAIYEQQGDYCVFVRLDEDCYRKVPVTVGESDGAYVAILSGLKAGDMVVDRGVTTVRLAGATGAVPEGHSHSH